MKRLFPIALIASVLAFASGSAIAQECGFDDQIDDDGDCLVSEEEFTEYYEEWGLFDEWDTNDDGWVGQDELASGLYSYADEDDDGYIDEGELEMTDDPDEAGFWDW